MKKSSAGTSNITTHQVFKKWSCAYSLRLFLYKTVQYYYQNQAKSKKRRKNNIFFCHGKVVVWYLLSFGRFVVSSNNFFFLCCYQRNRSININADGRKHMNNSKKCTYKMDLGLWSLRSFYKLYFNDLLIGSKELHNSKTHLPEISLVGCILIRKFRENSTRKVVLILGSFMNYKPKLLLLLYRAGSNKMAQLIANSTSVWYQK